MKPRGQSIVALGLRKQMLHAKERGWQGLTREYMVFLVSCAKIKGLLFLLRQAIPP